MAVIIPNNNIMTAMNPFKLERGKFQSLVNLGK